jgi:hypothetical protein
VPDHLDVSPFVQDVLGQVRDDPRDGGTALPDAGPSRPPLTRLGVPDAFPDVVFVSTHGLEGRAFEDDPYLSYGWDFHERWGLKPRRADSLESIVAALAAEKNPVGRVRLVTHGVPGMLQISMLKGGSPPAMAPEIAAWAASDGRGVSQVLDRLSDAEAQAEVLKRLRSGSPAVLAPFGLEASGTPTGVVELCIRRATDLRLSREGKLSIKGVPQPKLALGLRKAVALLEADMVADGVCRADQARALTAAIAALSAEGLGSFPRTTSDARSYVRRLEAALDAVARRWRGTLEPARAKLAAPYAVDIRGCDAGAKSVLEAVGALFSARERRVTVSGPRSFEWFGDTSTELLSPGDEHFAEVAPEVDVQLAVAHWSPAVGLPDPAAASPDGGRTPNNLPDPEGALRAYLEYARVLPVMRGSGDARTLTLYALAGVGARGRRALSPADAELWLRSQWDRAPTVALRTYVDCWTTGRCDPVATAIDHLGPGEIDAVLPDPDFHARLATV